MAFTFNDVIKLDINIVFTKDLIVPKTKAKKKFQFSAFFCNIYS